MSINGRFIQYATYFLGNICINDYELGQTIYNAQFCPITCSAGKQRGTYIWAEVL